MRSHFRFAAVVTLSLLFACSTPPAKDAALRVTVVVPPSLASRCVLLRAEGASGAVKTSKPMLVGDRSLDVAVAQSDLGASVTLRATGYADDNCSLDAMPAEGAVASSVAFVPGSVVPITLTLAVGATASDGGTGDAGQADAGADAGVPDAGPVDAGTPGEDLDHDGYPVPADCDDTDPDVHPGATELCDNGKDDDCNHATDCADATCATKPCATSDRCQTGSLSCQAGVCLGTGVKSCTQSADPCRAGTGTCAVADGTCSFPPTAGATCNDTFACTLTDQCSASGTCAGTPRVCPAAPGQCFLDAGACQEPSGVCTYPVRTGSCDDGNACTTGDTCAADGGCSGTAVTCTPPLCHTWGGSCSAGGACTYLPSTGGPCGTSGGTCSNGVCTLFPYAPANFVDADLPPLDGGVNLNVTCNVTLDTGGAAPTFGTNSCGLVMPPWVVRPSGGATPDVLLLAVNSLQVSAGNTLTITGSRVPVFAVVGNATLDGTLFVGGRSTGPGPGGDVDCATGRGAVGANPSTGSTGGGGGGGGAFGGRGGPGGKGANSNTFAAGGAVLANTDPLVPLRAGCSGGTGGGGTTAAAGGGAGGALQVSVSGTLTIGSNALLNAAGRGGVGATFTHCGGGGGGSGGALLLEARTLTITAGARLVANGGSGGQGADDNTAGADGTAGTTTASGALTSNASSSKGGGGGQGGALNGLDGVTGGTGDSNTNAGGGGAGGGVGRIRLNAQALCSNAGTFSPLASKGGNSPCP